MTLNTTSDQLPPGDTWLQRSAVRLMLDRHVERCLSAVDSVWSLARCRARVVEVIDETADAKTFVLRPNRLWRGHRAGQYTLIEVEIDGVRIQRCYTLSSAPGESTIAITVKRVQGGLVSNWLHDCVGPGHVLGLGPAAGGFVLPEAVPSRLLLYTGGSGITPAMSILRDLDRRGAVHNVVFVHHARSRRDVIFARELAELEARHHGLRVELRIDDEIANDPPVAPQWLARAVPDFGSRPTYLCGPGGLMTAVETAWRQSEASECLVREQFTAATVSTPSEDNSMPVSITLAASGRVHAAPRTLSLLDALEAAGERPARGCRMGICNTCVCRKRAGAVRNTVTGAESSEPDEDIRLCVSVPISDELELEL